MTHHLVGVAEVAELLRVSRQRVDQLAASYRDFPKPEAELAAGRIWSKAAVEGWIAIHPDRRSGREEGRPISFERFTDRARTALVLATEEASRAGHNYVGCEHLVIGLIREGTGLAGRALAARGLTLEAARDAVSRLLATGPTNPIEPLPHTRRLKAALAEAESASLEFRHGDVGTEHLLLGILREGENVGCRLLIEAGQDLTDVRLKVLELMGYPQPHTERSDQLERLIGMVAAVSERLERIEQRLDSGSV